MKDKKLLILLIIITGAFLFYWFQIRPAEVRKACYKKAIPENNNTAVQDHTYRSCLVEHGLKSEPLY